MEKDQKRPWQDKPLDEVIDDLKKKKLPLEVITALERKQRSIKEEVKLRHVLAELNVDDLMSKENGVKTYQDCLLLFDYLDELEDDVNGHELKSSKALKIFNDPIHGHIQLHPACQLVVDTPQFQRLRFIKQLGMVYFVFPGASHNRFEHTLGVCHLAGQFARALRQNQPRLGITDTDILCVEIAGLCLSLGHGPFSRLYTDRFLYSCDKKKTHPKPSSDMLEHLLAANGLREKLKFYGLEEVDITFIKEQIGDPKPTGSTAWSYEGRPKEKAFLYEIVNNRRNGVDVYKWDYLARDCHHLGIKNNFDWSRYMKFARVIEMDGELQICVRDKEIANLYNMFYTRYTLNKYAYHHKVNCGMEIMVTRALKKANEHVRYEGESGEQRSLYQCYSEMSAYSKLTDNVLFKILNAPIIGDDSKEDSQLQEAQDIIKRIFRRDLYRCVYESIPMSPESLRSLCNWDTPKLSAQTQNSSDQTNISQDQTSVSRDQTPESPDRTSNRQRQTKNDVVKEAETDESKIKQKILSQLENEKDKDYKKMVIVMITHLDFGMKEENPVDRLKVYSKRDPNHARTLPKEEASRIMGPVSFNELIVRVYCTCTSRANEVHDAVKKAAEKVLKQARGPLLCPAGAAHTAAHTSQTPLTTAHKS
ncbi:unnamed protein product [Lymnaea stagnalis]|uniref:Deoxynucleoside triphosphate triphosphohydrolase SAMHD1 n=1 Tax=Lymnaea stagnalis TaxID=6523 RepID=A0AAV2IB66_LYMST